MKTITIKTELEQFQEQYPELYQQIFDLGYNSYLAQQELYEDDNNPFNYNCYPEYATPIDESERFYKFGSFDDIYNKASALENEGYKSGNKDWRQFLNNYRDWKHAMYIAWNPTHMLFAVESDPSAINELYPHLVNAEEQV